MQDATLVQFMTEIRYRDNRLSESETCRFATFASNRPITRTKHHGRCQGDEDLLYVRANSIDGNKNRKVFTSRRFVHEVRGIQYLHFKRL